MVRILFTLLIASLMFASQSAATPCSRNHDGSCSTSEEDGSSLLQQRATFESAASLKFKDAAEGLDFSPEAFEEHNEAGVCPTGFRFSHHGIFLYHGEYSSFQQTQESNLSVCAGKCDNHASCIAFSFNPPLCAFYSWPLRQRASVSGATACEKADTTCEVGDAVKAVWKLTRHEATIASMDADAGQITVDWNHVDFDSTLSTNSVFKNGECQIGQASAKTTTTTTMQAGSCPAGYTFSHWGDWGNQVEGHNTESLASCAERCARMGESCDAFDFVTRMGESYDGWGWCYFYRLPLGQQITNSTRIACEKACWDMQNDAKDVDGDGCQEYYGHGDWCGKYDDGDFSSQSMCCACGGGGSIKPTTTTTTTTTTNAKPSSCKCLICGTKTAGSWPSGSCVAGVSEVGHRCMYDRSVAGCYSSLDEYACLCPNKVGPLYHHPHPW